MTEAWTIDWFVCRMDPDDVKHAKSEGKDAKIGDELWRVPVAIGPIGTDHNHWASYCLTGEPEDWNLAAAAPRLYAALKTLRDKGTNATLPDLAEADLALAQARGEI